MNRFFLFLLILCTGLSCHSDSQSSPSEDLALPAPAAAPLRTPFLVNIDYLRMRETPGQAGEVIKNLQQGDTLFDLGEVSSFTTRVQLRGIWFNEPWLRVETTDGVQGWVYGGGLHLGLDGGSAVGEQLMEKRLQTFLGPGLAHSVGAYRKAFQEARTSAAFAALYERGGVLRDSIVEALETRVEVPESGSLPNLFWLEETMPGFITQLVGEGTAYYLFRDFKELGGKAARTAGREDDAFLAICFQVFPIDSMEHFFPAWTIQASDDEVHSELGKGLHLRLLEQMNETLANSALFEKEIESLKMALVDDITRPDNTYWFDQEAILQEVDAILAAHFGLLSQADKVALEARRQQLAHPADHGIQLNIRSGVYDE